MTSEVEWRRKWKADLSAEPWKPQKVKVPRDDNSNFLVKSRIGDDSYQILISNTNCLWYESLDADGVKKRTKNLNPSVEAPVPKILDHLRESLAAPNANLSASFKVLANENEDEKITLTLSTKLAGLPFIWKFSGYPADSQQMSDHLTVPLLAMVEELSRRQRELHKLLRNKDKEIDDLKGQGVKVSRRHLETPVFDETVFKHTMSTSKEFTDHIEDHSTKAFDSVGQELYRDIMMKRAYINRPEHEDPDFSSGTFSSDDPQPSDGGTTGGATSWSNRVPPSLNPTGGSSSTNSSPRKSPTKSPAKSPAKATEDLTQQRREELEQRLQEEEQRREEKTKKKKKKMKF